MTSISHPMSRGVRKRNEDQTTYHTGVNRKSGVQLTVLKATHPPLEHLLLLPTSTTILPRSEIPQIFSALDKQIVMSVRCPNALARSGLRRCWEKKGEMAGSESLVFVGMALFKSWSE